MDQAWRVTWDFRLGQADQPATAGKPERSLLKDAIVSSVIWRRAERPTSRSGPVKMPITWVARLVSPVSRWGASGGPLGQTNRRAEKAISLARPDR